MALGRKWYKNPKIVIPLIAALAAAVSAVRTVFPRSAPYPRLTCDFATLENYGTYEEKEGREARKHTAARIGIKLTNAGSATSRNICAQITLPDGCWGLQAAGLPEFEYRLPSGEYRVLGPGCSHLAGKPSVVALRLKELAPALSVQANVLYVRETNTTPAKPSILVYDDHGPTTALEVPPSDIPALTAPPLEMTPTAATNSPNTGTTATPGARLECAFHVVKDYGTYRDNVFQAKDKYLATKAVLKLTNAGAAPSRNIYVQVSLPAGSWGMCVDGFPEFQSRLPSGVYKTIGAGSVDLRDKPQVVTIRLHQLAPSISVSVGVVCMRENGTPFSEPTILVHDDQGVAQVTREK